MNDERIKELREVSKRTTGPDAWKHGLAKSALEALPELLDEIARLNSHRCPCEIADAPCDPRCTCVVSHSSMGCACCVRYGSAGQRRAAANRLVKQAHRADEIARLQTQLAEAERKLHETRKYFGSDS